MPQRIWLRRLVTVGYWIFALQFFTGAVTKYWPGTGPFGADLGMKFEGWGYPSWFRFVVGTIELFCAVLLVIPNRRSHFLAGAILVLLLDGAVTTHIVNHNPLSGSYTAPVCLVIAFVIVLTNWPADWRNVFRPPAAAPSGVEGQREPGDAVRVGD